MPKNTKAMQRPSKRPARRGTPKRASPAAIAAWQDDPASGLDVISRPVPELPRAAETRSRAPPSRQRLRQGTPRSVTGLLPKHCVAAGFLGADMGVTKWEPGPVLGVSVDKSVDLNAYYDRTELAFFIRRSVRSPIIRARVPTSSAMEMGHHASTRTARSCSMRRSSKRVRSTSHSAI